MNYIYGKVVWTSKKQIILECYNIGYRLNVTNGENYQLDKFQKVYIYKNMKIDHKNNIVEEYYGFTSCIERNFFADLLQINGIGQITAFNIMSNDINSLLNDIVSSNYEVLKTYNGITPKNAILIGEGLKSKYANYVNSLTPQNKQSQQAHQELIFALKKLGYKSEDLKVVNEIEVKDDYEISELISESIKLIARKHEEHQANY